MMRTRNQSRHSFQSSQAANLKRSAIESPSKGPPRKRSAFGDLTNAISNNLVIDSTKKDKAQIPPAKKKTSNKRGSSGGLTLTKTKEDLSAIPEEVLKIPLSRFGAKTTATRRSRSGSAEIPTAPPSDESVTATSSLDGSDTCEVQLGSRSSSSSSDSEIDYHNKRDTEERPLPSLTLQQENQTPEAEEDLEDFDLENIDDIYHVPHYAKDIFRHYKNRETQFSVADYLGRGETTVTRTMRAILVDWMVEIQENFELNHETLYMAVKLTDLYLDRVPVSKENLQLVGSTALFVASKFDERCPPCCDDFLYICDDAYSKEELFQCERDMLNTLQFDIGMPLSYRYLRRYAKVSKVTMDVLTLGRYILETSLMHYEFVTETESRMASASFLLALRMKKAGDWTPLLEKQSGWGLKDVEQVMWRLNAVLTGPAPAKNVKTILTKYSHEVFFEVAKTEPLSCSGADCPRATVPPKRKSLSPKQGNN